MNTNPHHPCTKELARLQAELADARRSEQALREALLRFAMPGRAACFCNPPPNETGAVEQWHSDRCTHARKALAGELPQ